MPAGSARQPIDRHAQLVSRQRRGVVHRLDARNPDDRTLPVKPDARQRQRLNRPAALDEQLGAGLKPLLGKIGVEIHDDLAANAVRPGNPSDRGHLIPLRRLLPDCRLIVSGLSCP